MSSASACAISQNAARKCVPKRFASPITPSFRSKNVWWTSSTIRSPCSCARFAARDRRAAREVSMNYQLKSISKAGIAEALAKVELYRYLNEPEEAESICRDILSVDPDHQLARRMLGLAITDQFTAEVGDRYAELGAIFEGLRDTYELFFYTVLLYEPPAKAQLRAGRAAHILLPTIA